MRTLWRYIKRAWDIFSHADTAWSIFQSAWSIKIMISTPLAVVAGFLASPHGWLIVFFSVLGSIAIALFIVNQSYEKKYQDKLMRNISINNPDILPEPPNGTSNLASEQLTGPYIHGHRFRIGDLAKDFPIIKGKTFVKCEVFGPAIMLCFNKTHFDSCTFSLTHKDIESILFEVETSRTVTGVVGIDNCIFRDCGFYLIGLMGTKEQLDKVREATPQEFKS